jgi:hypothetical protein
MGTSGAYAGSGGRAWSEAREQAGEYASDPSNANAEQLLGNIADALDWDDEDVDEPGGGNEGVADQQRGAQQPLRISTPRGRGGGGVASGAGAADGGGRVRGAGGRGGGGGRSRSRAAAVGGGVAAAGLALRDRDADALLRFGLTLSELDGLGSYEQAQRILDAVGASLGGLEEDELNRASAAALLALLTEEGASGADAVRLFVTEYVFEVTLTEIGDEFRDGTRDGFATVELEDKLHDLIEADVSQVDLPDTLGLDDVQQAIFTALDDARTFLRAHR